MKRPQTAFDLQKLLMEEQPAAVEEKTPSKFLETLSQPLSKFFSR